MATQHQTDLLEKRLREYRKRYLTKQQNMELDESATRLMVNFFLTGVMGYVELDDIKTEYSIRGEYADYVIQLARKKHFVIEVKSIQIDLNARHLRQSTSYAANEGIDWILLFNGKQIQLYRVIFAKPISVHKVFEFDLSELPTIKQAAEHLIYLTKPAVAKGEMETYWKRFDALTPASLIKTVYSADVIKAIRLKVKKNSGINFEQNDVLEAVHALITNAHEASKPKNLK
ncbi:MAG TPA: hypothetical protein VF597_02565 [Candidatus Saccharimonadales bacterium]|jgi:hypothetical protein